MVCLCQRIRFAAILMTTCVSTQIAQGNVEWKAESFNDRAGQVLAVLGKQLVALKKFTQTHPLCSPSFPLAKNVSNKVNIEFGAERAIQGPSTGLTP